MATVLKPYSNAGRRFDSAELYTLNTARRPADSPAARTSDPCWHTSTEWRCENVPRSASRPVRRTDMPSSSRVPNASASAWPHSMPPCSPIASRRRSSCLARRGFGVKSCGHCNSDSFTNWRRSAATAVCTGRGAGAASTGHGACFSLPSNDCLNAAWISAYRCDTSFSTCAASSAVSTPSLTTDWPTPAAPWDACGWPPCAWAVCTSARRLRCARGDDSPPDRSARLS